MRKQVLVDARMVGALGHGIANYVQQMAEGLAARSLPFTLTYLVAPDLPSNSPLKKLPHQVSAVPFLHPLEPLRLGKEIARLRPSLYHSPSFASLLHYPCPYVQTVHDLNHLKFGGIGQKLYYRFLLLPSLRNARAIVSVSESARKELEAWLAAHGAKRQLRLAVNSIARPQAEKRQGPPYFLALGNPKAHKNLMLLKAAYRKARAQASLPPLWIAGEGKDEEGIHQLGALPTKELNSIYANAQAFFWPSLYEGFGRPPLEAALTGTVPVVSDIPVHREILAGVNEAIFLPATDTAAWTEAFLAMKEKKEVSSESQGKILATYSLDRLAAAMEEIYREALA